jgi:uncharacterized Tic20 family protein
MTTTPPPANPYAGTQQPMNPQDEKLWATLIHLSPLVAGIIGLPFLGPLIGYLVLRDRGPFVRWHTAQALNFQLTVLLAYIVSLLLAIIVIGFFLLAVVWVISIVFMIIAAVAANRGEYYKYPLTINFVS